MGRLLRPDNDEAKKEVNDLMEQPDVFDTPKPIRLVKRMVEITTKKGDESIILDFFAGSGTTTHAVLDMNRVNGGNRRSILVQLPEPLDPENRDQREAANFCDKLGKPRNIAPNLPRNASAALLRRSKKRIQRSLTTLVFASSSSTPPTSARGHRIGTTWNGRC